MSNLAQNDVLETGMEFNDEGMESSTKWQPLTLKTSWPLIKEYCRQNISVWKASMTALAIIIFIISLYLATFAGQLKTAMTKFGIKIGGNILLNILLNIRKLRLNR